VPDSPVATPVTRYTSSLALSLAAAVGGASLGWAPKEVKRARAFATARRPQAGTAGTASTAGSSGSGSGSGSGSSSGGGGGGLLDGPSGAVLCPDPSNRDPNYLLVAELASSPWHLAMADALNACRQSLAADAPPEAAAASSAARPGSGGVRGGGGRGAGGGRERQGGAVSAAACVVHFDLHGAGGDGTDLFVGLGAMAEREAAEREVAEREAARADKATTAAAARATPPVSPTRTARFRAALKAGLEGLLWAEGFEVDASDAHRLQGCVACERAPFPPENSGARLVELLVTGLGPASAFPMVALVALSGRGPVRRGAPTCPSRPWSSASPPRASSS
jgi:hypothetical protein